MSLLPDAKSMTILQFGPAHSFGHQTISSTSSTDGADLRCFENSGSPKLTLRQVSELGGSFLCISKALPAKVVELTLVFGAYDALNTLVTRVFLLTEACTAGALPDVWVCKTEDLDNPFSSLCISTV